MEHRDVDYDGIKAADHLSESKEGESSYSEYDSDCECCSSDCSITSGQEDNQIHEAITLFSDWPAVDAVSLQADESTDTTWTDDKHSSYLDSMEATFVRKMYDKQYCSLDVCGHSSQTSITQELECVESHPFCLNMRKPHEQPMGIKPFRALTRPWLSASSVLASPWIQHFKAKQVLSIKNSEGGGNALETDAPNCPASPKIIYEPSSAFHDTVKNNLLVSKKRAALFDASGYVESEVNARRSYGAIAGAFKKLKCQRALSQMDVVMEEQYTIEQQIQELSHLDRHKDGKVPSDITKEEHVMLQISIFEADQKRKLNDASLTSCFKEKQENDVSMDMGLGTTVLSKESLLKKADQVVPSMIPSSKVCRNEVYEKSIVQDMSMPSKEAHDMHGASGDSDAYITEEDGSSSHSSEQESPSTWLGSKTWTWGTKSKITVRRDNATHKFHVLEATRTSQFF